jgi:hypothetical protein
MIPSEPAPPPSHWPTSPYKGLGFYTSTDAPLLAGRDDDIARCARALEPSAARILFLHGPTGCGKSSFLRAGLIPRLEEPDIGFRFLREGAAPDAKALLIRSTDQPMAILAEKLCQMLNAGLTVNTRVGEKQIDLRKPLPPDLKDAECTSYLREPAALTGVLENLSGIIPYTLVIIIDQAEEVLTVEPGPAGEEARTDLFDFLAGFTDASFDMKLIVALRTEYYGRFYSRLSRAFADSKRVREYSLEDLTPEQMLRAIVRPTLESPKLNGVSAREFYKFTYEDGLAEKIVSQLNETEVAGGMLPVLQIVCSTLWERGKAASGGGFFQIKAADLDAMGGPTGQVGEHLDRVLLSLARPKMPIVEAFREVDRWKVVLNRLVRSQADGTVTTDIVKEIDLVAACNAKDKDQDKDECKLGAEETLAYLAGDDVRILRPVWVPERKSENKLLCYSLGHDTLGLVLRRWNILRNDTLERERRSSVKARIWSGTGLGLCLLYALASQLHFWMWKIPAEPVYGLVAAFYLGLIFAGSFVRTHVGDLPTPPIARALQLTAPFVPKELARTWLASGNNSRLFQAYPFVKDAYLKRAYPPSSS